MLVIIRKSDGKVLNLYSLPINENTGLVYDISEITTSPDVEIVEVMDDTIKVGDIINVE